MRKVARKACYPFIAILGAHVIAGQVFQCMVRAHFMMVSRTSILLIHLFALSASAQIVSYDGFEEYAFNAQFESGANGSSGVGLNGGLGWNGAYDVNNAIKTLVKDEDRTAAPVAYTNGDIAIDGGTHAMRLYDVANGSATFVRPLSETFSASDTLFFSFLFRTTAASPLANQDFFQLGFDTGTVTNPRLSIGANTTATAFPPSQPFRFFARSTTATTAASNAFDNTTDIAATTTYFLVGKLTGSGSTFDHIDLFVNPSTSAEPASSASLTLNSGVTNIDTLILRTAFLDNGDAYVFDELRIARDWQSVIPEPNAAALLLLGATLVTRRRKK